jgi:hypothetical protein
MKWWSVRERLNGKFWLVTAFCVASIVVASSTYLRVTQGVTAEDLMASSALNREITRDALAKIEQVIAALAVTTHPPEGGWQRFHEQKYREVLEALERSPKGHSP